MFRECILLIFMDGHRAGAAASRFDPSISAVWVRWYAEQRPRYGSSDRSRGDYEVENEDKDGNYLTRMLEIIRFE